MSIYPRKCLHCQVEISGRLDKKFCSRRCKQNYREKNKRKPYTIHKKMVCEECGFVPIHPCQLDVDHMDGDKKNNNIENLKTLCANCHRLKTRLKRDFVPLNHR
jgi:hypothetical protein